MIHLLASQPFNVKLHRKHVILQITWETCKVAKYLPLPINAHKIKPLLKQFHKLIV
jgi:hypothetical protein